MHTSPILVIGATGKTGRRIAQKLEDAGHTVRHGSRNAAIPFDWEDPAGWPAALEGVSAAYVSYFPDLAVPQAPAAITQLTAIAKEAGVTRLVLLSGRGEANARRCEEIVRDSGIDFTLVRASWFFQNFDEGQLLGSVLGGTIAMPAGNIREPFIDIEDIADVAVAALTEARHGGQLYEVTGPRLLSFADVAAEISKASGRTVNYLPVTLEQFHAALSDEAGPQMADMLTALCREVFDGRNESLSDGVRRALGREPHDFSVFCRDAAATGVWNPPAEARTA
ncbi:NmrA family NAD(P)-binding protein [Nitratireductor sp. XY-223]|uniref:NmrA family NAD(P)-binding protein n=1 Tax=Nitratireductor sp. XY-223 TaxID=2561926 RepID=UPI0010AAF614|nr:NmrA family NAD(P)-binding protein [Nitratireductor sp. XY-223]